MGRFNYELTKVFLPNALRKSKFTEVAKDNKDFSFNKYDSHAISFSRKHRQR